MSRLPADEYHYAFPVTEDQVPVQLSSAYVLGADSAVQLEQQIQERVGRPVNVTCKVDPNLVAGVTVRIGDILLDGSVAGTLQDLYERYAAGLEQGAFNALQHSRNAYEKLLREQAPRDAQEMAALWVAEVGRRLEAAAAENVTNLSQTKAPKNDAQAQDPEPDGNGDGPGELDSAFPRFGNGDPLSDNPAELEAYNAHLDATGQAPADVEALRAWYQENGQDEHTPAKQAA